MSRLMMISGMTNGHGLLMQYLLECQTLASQMHGKMVGRNLVKTDENSLCPQLDVKKHGLIYVTLHLPLPWQLQLRKLV